MKLIGLFLILITSTSAFADQAYHGYGNDYKKCFLTLHDSGHFSMKSEGYFFTGLRLPEEMSPGMRQFYDMTKAQGDSTYVRVDGPEGAFDRVGILEVNGTIMSVGDQPYSVTLFATGGLFNWYAKQFACSDMKLP